MNKTVDIKAASDALHRIELPDEATDRLYDLLLEYSESSSPETMARLLDGTAVLAHDYPMEPFKRELANLSRMSHHQALQPQTQS